MMRYTKDPVKFLTTHRGNQYLNFLYTLTFRTVARIRPVVFAISSACDYTPHLKWIIVQVSSGASSGDTLLNY